jgi:putative membrane protein
VDAAPRASGPAALPDGRILAIQRPARALLTCYAITSLAGLFLAPVIFLPLFFKYHTLRYRIDEEGISASWGILFRREIHLTYKRIQDIHVSRNIIERWLGIGRVELQTASGSASAELVLEGMTEHEAVRDFLYARMRGHGAAGARAPEAGALAGEGTGGGDEGAALALLREVRSELEALRRVLEVPPRGPAQGTDGPTGDA